MQTKPTNRMRVFTDEEIDGINGPKFLNESEISDVSGGLSIIRPCPIYFPFPIPSPGPGPTCPSPFPFPFPTPFPGPGPTFPPSPWDRLNEFY